MSTKVDKRVAEATRKRQVVKEIKAQNLQEPYDQQTLEDLVNTFTLPDGYDIRDRSASNWGPPERALFAFGREWCDLPDFGKHSEQAKKDVANSENLLRWLSAFIGAKIFSSSPELFDKGGNLGAFLVGLRELSFEGQVQILRELPKVQTPSADPLIIIGPRNRRQPMAHQGVITGESLAQSLEEMRINEDESENDTDGDENDEQTETRDISGGSFKTMMSDDSIARRRRVVDEIVSNSVLNNFLNCCMASIVTSCDNTVVYTLAPVSFETPTPFGRPFKAKSDGAAWLHDTNGIKVSDTRPSIRQPLYVIEAKASADADPVNQQFGELVSAIYRKIVIFRSHGFTLNDLRKLYKIRPAFFSEYLISFNQVLWRLKYVDFPPEYLIQLFDGKKNLGGAALLPFNVKIMESSPLNIADPKHCRLMVETHHALDMQRAEEVLWLEAGCLALRV